MVTQSTSPEEFFANLPAELSPRELKLERLLGEVVELTRDFLPVDVSLEEWISRRSSKLVQHLDNPNVQWVGSTANEKHEDDFLRGLPADRFTDMEDQLREILSTELENGPLPISHFEEDSANWEGVPIASWIQRRLGEELEVFVEDGKQMLRLRPADPAEEWLSSLPETSFSDEEARLRQAVLNFLVLQKPDMYIAVGIICQDEAVSKAQGQALPENVPLFMWIQKRIGAELMYKEDSVRLTPDSRRSLLQEKAASGQQEQRGLPLKALVGAAVLQKPVAKDVPLIKPGLRPALPPGAAQKKPLVPPRGVPLRVHSSAASSKGLQSQGAQSGQPIVLASNSDAKPSTGPVPDWASDFFKGLPSIAFTAQEQALRQELIEYLKGYSQAKPGSGPDFNELAQHTQIQELRKDFLPSAIPMRLWIETRLKSQVVTRWKADRSGYEVVLKDGAAMADPAAKKTLISPNLKGLQQQKQQMASAPVTAAAASVEEAKKNFFASLPDDGFTDKEADLREALLTEMTRCYRKGQQDFVPLAQVCLVAAVQKSRAELFRGHAVNLLDWVDARIGGEVASCRGPGGEKGLRLQERGKPDGKTNASSSSTLAGSTKALKKEAANAHAAMKSGWQPPGAPPAKARPPASNPMMKANIRPVGGTMAAHKVLLQPHSSRGTVAIGGPVMKKPRLS